MKSRKFSILLMAAGLLLPVLIFLVGSRLARPDASDGDKDRRTRAAAPAHRDGSSGKRRAATKRPRETRTFAAFVGRIEEQGAPVLSAGELEAYMKTGGRTPDVLLAAYAIGRDESYLQEAIRRFPGHPRVLLLSIMRDDDPAAGEAFFKKTSLSCHGNGALGMLHAKALFHLGRSNEALGWLRVEDGKAFDPHSLASLEAGEKIYRAAGYSPPEAKCAAWAALGNPELAATVDVSKKLLEIRQTATDAGDLTTAEQADAVQRRLASTLGEGSLIIERLAALSCEKRLVEGDLSVEADAIRADISRRRLELTNGSAAVRDLMKSPAVPESDWVEYYDRIKQSNEKAANDWLLEKHPQP